MWYCFHEQDIGIDNFEGRVQQTITYMNWEQGSLVWSMWSTWKLKKAKLWMQPFWEDCISLLPTKQWKTMKHNPLQTPAWEAEKSCAEVCYDILIWAHARHTVFTLHCCLHCNPLVISGQSELWAVLL